MAIKDEILTLSPLEHVRLRPGVYAGDTSNSNQLVLEVFANALDCYNIGYGDTIKITIKNGIVTCEDDGQGFAINEKREDGTTTLEAAFSVMNTSGKFTDDGLYEGTSLGLNGMGSKICTFLSHWLKVTTYQKGIAEEITFKEGVFQERKIINGADKIHGTTVSFEPSEEFFDDPIPNLNYLDTFFNDICCLCPGLTIIFNDKVIKHDGIDDLLTRKIGNNIEITNHRLVFNETIDKQTLNLGLTFTSGSSSSITPYVNCGNTDTGPHITTIKSTITRVLNAWAKQDGCLKKDDKNLEGSSLQEGLVLVCNITSPTAAYNAQVKTTITKIDTTFINQIFSKELEKWLDNNPNDGRAIIEKALVARKAAEAAKRARARVKAEANDGSSKKVLKLPSKLADCHSTDRSKCELYITEGDSASGNLKNARNRETQAVLPIRGKILNTQKASLDKIMQNAEIIDMINAFGLKISQDGKRLIYDKNKIRYGKIIIMSDAK